jgi:hypothetical protein
MDASIRCTLCLVLVFSSCAQAELRFTCQSQEYELDGVKLRQLVFTDAGKRVIYTPPRGWQYFGDEDRLRLSPPSPQPGEGVISRTKLVQPQTFDDATIKRLTDEVVASLPGGARRVGVVSQEKNPLQIERKDTFLVVVKFELYGVPQSRSVMFLNRDAEQLRFQFTSPETSFAKLNKQFFISQFSWQNL